jgi:hypothetical protein
VKRERDSLDATVAAFLAPKPAPRTADLNPADTAAFLALDGSGEVALGAHM